MLFFSFGDLYFSFLYNKYMLLLKNIFLFLKMHADDYTFIGF